MFQFELKFRSFASPNDLYRRRKIKRNVKPNFTISFFQVQVLSSMFPQLYDIYIRSNEAAEARIKIPRPKLNHPSLR